MSRTSSPWLVLRAVSALYVRVAVATGSCSGRCGRVVGGSVAWGGLRCEGEGRGVEAADDVSRGVRYLGTYL